MFKLTMALDNDVFKPHAAPEIARALRYAADRVTDGHTVGPVKDKNGNTVGEFVLRKR